MAATECVDSTLLDILVHWIVTSGPFWIFLIIITTWFFKTDSSTQHHESQHDRNYITKQLGFSLKSRKDALDYFAMHVALLVMELVEGYWLLAYWWQCAHGYWTWNLKKSEWFLQFWQFVMLLLSGLALPLLLLFGFLLVVTTVACLNELWQWEPKSFEDTWQLIQREEEAEEEVKQEDETTVSALTSASSADKQSE